MAQKIILPNELKIADEHAIIKKDSFKMDVNGSDPKKVLASLEDLPNLLKEHLKDAKAENPERFKIELREIRLICLLWYNLDHIEDSQCNILLYQLKPELRWYIDETEKLYTQPIIEDKDKEILPEGQNEENNLAKSTVEDHLEQFKMTMTDSDYNKLVYALRVYFETGCFPDKDETIQVRKVPVKKFGWVLKELYKDLKDEALPIEYLRFAKENISLFRNVDFDESNFRKSQLYKYFTTKYK